MRIAVICSPDIVWATPVWEKTIPTIIADEHEIIGIFEIKGEPKYRKSYLSVFGIKVFIKLALYGLFVVLGRLLQRKCLSLSGIASEFGVPYQSFESPDEKEFLDCFEKQNIDITIAMTDHILPIELIEKSRLGVVNKHASLLPSFRGILPFIWASIADADQGVSYHYMNARIDEGELIYQRRIKVVKKESLIAFYSKVFLYYPKDIKTVLELVSDGRRRLQGNFSSSYYSYPGKADLEKFYKKSCKIIALSDYRNLINK